MIPFVSKKSALVLAIIVSGFVSTSFAQDEYDDLYFSSKDRKQYKYVEDNLESDANTTYESFTNNTYDNASYSAKEVNP